jgi:hypothetical protein
MPFVALLSLLRRLRRPRRLSLRPAPKPPPSGPFVELELTQGRQTLARS